jgi:hypothetical protein
MAGEIQLNSTSFASESGGTITINNATLASAVDLSNHYASTSEVQGTHTTGSITSGTTALTVASATGISNGDFVVGEGIAPGTTVSSGGGTTSITLSANASATLSSDPVSFYKADRVLSPGLVGSQLCRAFVNFSAAASPSIRSSYNVTSVTQDGGTGKYLINLLTALPDSPNATVLVNNGDLTKHSNRTFVSSGAQVSTTQIYVSFFDTAARDPDICSVLVFR